MSTVKPVAGTKTSLTSSSLATLASATYCVSSTYNNTTNSPVDLIVEVTAATTNTPAGNKQLAVFAQASYDAGTTWQTGPTSGTTTTDEPLLTFLGVLPIQTASVTETKAFPVAPAYCGNLPPYMRIVVKNDLGVALTSGTLSTIEQSVTVI
jgi:hypothetical protein